jgi:hypothetical protein
MLWHPYFAYQLSSFELQKSGGRLACTTLCALLVREVLTSVPQHVIVPRRPHHFIKLYRWSIQAAFTMHWWFSGKIGRCHLRDLKIYECRPAPGSIPGRCIASALMS